VARAHGRRHSAAETRDQTPPRRGSFLGVAAAVTATRAHRPGVARPPTSRSPPPAVTGPAATVMG